MDKGANPSDATAGVGRTPQSSDVEVGHLNPHAIHSVSLVSLISSICRQRGLIWQLTKRDVMGRYKGSIMGVMWSLLNPLFLLFIYTFVFSEVFKARWGTGPVETKSEYAILLFVGMIVHGSFAETLTRAPVLIVNNVSYVKKIVFPLEILPVVALGTALFHMLISVLVLVSFIVLQSGYLHSTILFLPLVVFPLSVMTLGVSWCLASLGVFLRDIAQPINLLMTILLFASPVFYPINALPEYIRPWLMLNPLTFVIEQARDVLIYGKIPDWMGLSIYAVLSLLIAWIGFAWFQKTRKGFADVL